MTARREARSRREFAAAIAACLAGAGLVLLALRQSWAHVTYTAPSPLPSGSLRVTGQNLLPAASALALAALACLAAVIATRGPARRAAGLAMTGLGVWIAWLASQPVRVAAVISAAASQAAPGGLAGSSPGGNSAISGSGTSGGGLPALGVATHVTLGTAGWQAAALAGAAAVIAAGLLTVWRGPGWAVMSARFDQPGKPARTGPAGYAPGRAGGGPAYGGPPDGGPPDGGSLSGGDIPPADASPLDDAIPSGGAMPPADASPLDDAIPSSGAMLPAGTNPPGGAIPSSSAIPSAGAGPPGGAIPSSSAIPSAGAGPPGGLIPPGGAVPDTPAYPEGDAAAIWEALDHGVDLTAEPGRGEAATPPRP